MTFPLFLLARELRLAKTEPSRVRSADTVALASLAVAVAGLTIWIDAT